MSDYFKGLKPKGRPGSNRYDNEQRYKFPYEAFQIDNLNEDPTTIVIRDGYEMSGVGLVNAGTVELKAFTTADDGFFLCDGASYDTTVESRLFGKIGYVFGGSGSSFNVPTVAAPANMSYQIRR